MQNGYAHDKGTFGKAGRDITLIKKTIAPITSAVEYCREKEIPIFYTQQIYVPEFFDAAECDFFKKRQRWLFSTV